MGPVYQRICHQGLALNPRFEAGKTKTNAQVHIVGVSLGEENSITRCQEEKKTYQAIVVNSPVVAKPGKR